MLKVSIPAVFVLSMIAASAAGSAKELKLANLSVGANLETSATVALSEAAPIEGLPVTITSNDPSKVRFSATPEEAGAASITVTARGNFHATTDFYVQGLSNNGSVTYTASAAGFERGAATVTLLPSAIVISGPHGAKSSFQATAGSRAVKLNVISAAVGGADNYTPQLVAGGMSAAVDLSVSDTAVGSLATPKLTIAGGSGSAVTLFQPSAPGQTTVTASVPAGFSPGAKFAAITALVATPGIGLTENVFIGQNLQIGGAVSLGTFAGKGGVQVTLTSDHPEKLLLSASETEKGSGTITVTVPENAVTVRYFLQALDGSGTVTYTGTATGYRSRMATVALTPSGVVMVGPLTLPEGQLFRSPKQGGARQQGFLTTVSGKPTRLLIHTVQLDPVSHRAADITIQGLRAGMDLDVDLKNTNPDAGSIDPRVTIHGGTDHAVTQFVPKGEGSVELSVVTPPGFTQSSNDALLKVTVSK